MLVLALTHAKITCEQLTDLPDLHRSLDCSGNADNSCLKDPLNYFLELKVLGTLGQNTANVSH